MRKVVVTGIGIYSTIGIGKEEVINSLRIGKCGLIRSTLRESMGFRSGLTGNLEEPSSDNRFAASETLYMIEAAKEAINDSHLSSLDCGVIIGNDGSSRANAQAISDFNNKKSTSRLGSTHIFKSLTSNPSSIVSKVFKLSGTSFTLAGACASGGHAIGVASSLISSGIEDVIVCGACQEINYDSTFSFDAIRAFSVNTDPKESVRPFDIDRDGTVPSGGAACLILEEYEYAKQRGAKIYAEICKYGTSSSMELSTTTMNGALSSINKAIDGIDPTQIEVISTHSTGTVVGDEDEAHAIEKVFGNKPYITATKALTGHEMWMAGVSEVIYTILSLKSGFIPPNPNTLNCPFSININKDLIPIERKTRYVLSNSFGLGGTNSSILFKVYE